MQRLLTFFSANYINTTDFMSSRRLNKSLTTSFVLLTKQSFEQLGLEEMAVLISEHQCNDNMIKSNVR